MTGTGFFKNQIRFGASVILNTLFPALCPSCSEPVDEVGSLCANCWPLTEFISAPKCVQCGYPFDYTAAENMKCGTCLARPPSFQQGASVLKYDEHSRAPILAFKHADRTDMAPTFAKWMSRAGRDLLQPDCLITPVPLHSRRLLARRYNQSALLAQLIAKENRLKWSADLLIRKKNTPSQGGKSLKARFKNVQGAFSLNPKRKHQIPDAHVILIDDVFTTGATIEACASCLHQEGAAKVSFLTLSRVVRASALTI